MSNIYGAIVGGMLYFVEVFVSGYIPNGTAYSSIIAFVVVVFFIVFKPEGIIGEKPWKSLDTKEEVIMKDQGTKPQFPIFYTVLSVC